MRALTADNRVWLPVGLYVLLCLVLWMIPLFNLLHAESSAVIAGVSFFIAGLDSLSRFKTRASLFSVLNSHLTLLLIPWGMMSLSLLWQDNCSYGQGLLFFLVFSIPGVILSVSIAYLISSIRVNWKKSTFVLLGMLLAIGGVVYDLGFHSQFFTYNHVFGGVVGPIYDEELTIRGGLIAFKLRSILLAACCCLIATHIKSAHIKSTHFMRKNNAGLSVVTLLVAMLIALSYLFAAQLRINTPAWFIQQHLGGHIATEHFDIYYDESSMDTVIQKQLAGEHEYRYQFIRQQLDIDVSQKIQSFIYPDTETKDWLTGSKNTSVAPVWLAQPQMHMLEEFFEYVFPHELAHVFSREFGLPVINASLSVGLVEGLAVSLEPADGRPNPHEQVLTAVTRSTSAQDTIQIDSSIGLADRLSPLGFWTGRGSVSYTTMGSFVDFLAEVYGYEPVKQVYASSNFEAIFGKPVETLVREWEEHVSKVPYVDRATNDYVTRRFAIPSLFEKACPHHLPAYEKHYRKGVDALAKGDTLLALNALETALEEEPAYELALDTWSLINLSKGAVIPVIERIDEALLEGPAAPIQFSTALIWTRLGDALSMSGSSIEAIAAYDSAMVRLPLFAHQQRGFITLRSMLAQNSEVQEILSSGKPLLERVKRLDAIQEQNHYTSLLQALMSMVAKDDEATLAYLKIAEDLMAVESLRDAGNQILLQLNHILQMEMNYNLGNYEDARIIAREVQAYFETVGAFNSAMQYADFANKMSYIVEHN